MKIKLIHVKGFIRAPKLLLTFIRDRMQKTVIASEKRIGSIKKLFISEAPPRYFWHGRKARGKGLLSCILLCLHGRALQR